MHVPDQEPLLWPRSLLHSRHQDSMGIPRIPRAGALFATFRIGYDQELREKRGIQKAVHTKAVNKVFVS